MDYNDIINQQQQQLLLLQGEENNMELVEEEEGVQDNHNQQQQQKYYYKGQEEEEEEEGEEDQQRHVISQEDSWNIITAFFGEKGLVRQQLDSYDEFVQNTMQEIVDENASLLLQTNSQHSGGENDVTVKYTKERERWRERERYRDRVYHKQNRNFVVR